MEEKHYSNHGAVRREVQPSGHRRAFSHDYREVGTYMVTMVTEGRARVFGHIEGSAMATKKLDRDAWVRDWAAPHIVLSELGRRVLEEEVPQISRLYPQVEVWRVAMMPDHIHLLLRVKERLPEGKHLGSIVRGFKTGCTRAWWALQDAGRMPGARPGGNAPGTRVTEMAGRASGETPGTRVAGMAGRDSGEATGTRAAEMAGSGAVVPEAFPSGCNGSSSGNCNENTDSQSNAGSPSGADKRPVLFEAGYHDRIINRPGMLDNIKRYMMENPLRFRIREECPRLMERQLHLWIGGREYAAFGNLFLLKYPIKQQVFFHRFTPVEESERAAILASAKANHILTDKERERMATDRTVAPTHLTLAYAREHQQLLQQAEGGTVLITPGISKGESIVANDAIERQLPLILLQVRPFSRYWKPEERRYYACANGHLLILSPWQLDGVSDYEHFHRLNDLAKEICEATEMRIVNYSELHSHDA